MGCVIALAEVLSAVASAAKQAEPRVMRARPDGWLAGRIGSEDAAVKPV